MSFKPISGFIVFFSVAILLPIVTVAQETNTASECATGEDNAHLYESLVSDIRTAYEGAEQAAVAVQRIRAQLANDRIVRSEALQDYNEYLNAIDESTLTHTRVVRELSSEITAAGGNIVAGASEIAGFGIEIPPIVRFDGGKFNAQNNRLFRIREYIQAMVEGLQGAASNFEFSSDNITQLEDGEKSALQEFTHSIDKLNSQRRALALYLRLCGDQSERTIENRLIAGQPDISAPDMDRQSTNVGNGILATDPYWQALANDDAEALFEMELGDDMDEGAFVRSEEDTGSPTIQESSPDQTPDTPAATNEVGEAIQPPPTSDENDYGLPGISGPLLPSVALPEPDVGTTIPSTSPGPGTRGTIVPFPGLPEVNLSDVVSPEAIALLETINATGVNISSLVPNASACGWNATVICSRFPSLSEADLRNCLTSVTEAKTMCTNWLQRKDTTLSVARCQADCSTRASQARAGLSLYQMAQNSVRAVAITQLQNQRDLEAKHEQTRARLMALRNEVQSHQLHIYVHADTGEMTIHDGPYFEPQPPLVYSGTSQRPATFEQSITLAELTQKLENLEQSIKDISEQLANHTTWENTALSHWDAIFSKGSPDSCATASDIERPLAQCHADCAAQGEPNEAIGYFGPLPQEFCRQSTNTLGAMMNPDAERWLSNN